MQIKDQSTDLSGFKMHQLFSGIEIPDFVKSAELDSCVDLPAESYADPGRRAYPIHDKANTFISNAYFFDKLANLKAEFGEDYVARVAERINSMADMYGITDQLRAFEKQSVEHTSRDYDEHTIFSNSFTTIIAKTANEFENAANNFVEHIEKYPFSWRKEMCQGFIEKAAMFGVDEIPDIICKHAGLFYPDVAAMRVETIRRMRKNAEDNHDLYTEVLNKIEDIHSNEEAYKLAEEVYDIEEKTGMYDNDQVSCYLKDPVEAFFPLSIEKVAEMLDVVEMGGERYKMIDLQNISADRYKQAFDADIDPTKTAELRDVLPTMPREDIALFKELTGIQPV